MTRYKDVKEEGLRPELTNKNDTTMSGDLRTTRRISALSELDSLKPVWNDLVEQGACPGIFQTFEWISAWWEAYGADHTLYVLTFEFGARVVGLAPLMLTESSRLGKQKKVIEFIGAPQADYGDFIGPDKKMIAELTLEYLREHGDDWTEINLAELSERSDTIEPLKEVLTANSMPHYVRESETCHSFQFEGDESDRETFKPKRSKRLRRSVNWFTRQGNLRLEEIRDPDKITQILPGFFHTHIVRWRDTFRPSMFLETDHRAFYEALVHRLAPLGRISFFVLRFEEKPIAYEFNFLYRNCSGHYTIAHDKLHHSRSVGRIINHWIRDHYVKQGLQELDFSRGAHEYKDALSNRSYINYRIRIFSNPRALKSARRFESFKAAGPVRRLVENKKFNFRRQRFDWLRHTYGLKGMVRKGLGLVASTLVDSQEIWVLAHTSQKKPDEPRLELEFARVDESRLNEIASFAGAQAESEHYGELARRIGGKADCFVARHHGNIVCMGWGLRQLDTDPVTGFTIEPAHDQALLSGGYTSPALRGKGIRPWLMARQLDYYRSQKLSVIAAVARDNEASLRVMAKMGFQRVAVFRVVRLLGQQIWGPRTARVTLARDI